MTSSNQETQTAVDRLLDGAIDAHVHGAPDIVPRLMTVVEVARDGQQAGLDGVLLLNHYSETTSQAAIVDEVVDDIMVRGGIKLNHPVGGLNPDAVEVVTELGAAKVDMPTQHAANEFEVKGKDPEDGVSVMADGELKPEVHKILDIVAASDATVATGHLSAEEAVAVAEAALDHGINHPVISHPELASIGVPIEDQKRLADEGAVVEYCYINTTDVLHGHFDDWTPYAPEDLLEPAREVGPESVILATDFGQESNPAPSEGFRSFVGDALEFGFSEDEVETMLKDNPRRVYNF